MRKTHSDAFINVNSAYFFVLMKMLQENVDQQNVVASVLLKSMV